MLITNDTTVWQVAEAIGPDADDIDGRILLGLLSRDCVTDTDELTTARWGALVQEAAKLRRDHDARDW